MATTTVQHAEPGREKLQPFVLPDTALRLRMRCVVTGKTQGELIDELVQAHLPPVTVAEQPEA
jgi:hypothetical protein